MERGYLIRGILTVIGGFLCNFTCGRTSTFGNLSPYISSYLRYRTANDWVTNGYMIWIISVGFFIAGGFMPLGGLLENEIGGRLTCFIGAWTMSLGILLTYFTIKQGFWAVLGTYGILSGIGNGFTFTVSIGIAIKWFPQHKGIVSGAVVSGFGFGSVVFTVIQTKYINPMNRVPNGTHAEDKYFKDPEVLDRIPSYFLLMGGTYAVIQLIMFLLMSNRSDYKSPSEKKPLLDQPSQATTSTENREHEDFTVRGAVKEYRFWILCGTFFFRGFGITFIRALYKSFGQTFIEDDEYFAIVGAVSAVCNSAGRFIYGFLFDRLPYKILMFLSSLAYLSFLFPLYFSKEIKDSHTARIVFGISICVLFFIKADCYVLLPAATAGSFGKKNMSTIYGCVFFSMSVVGIIGAAIAGELIEKIHYFGIFIIAAGGSIISMILSLFFPRGMRF